MRIICIGLLLLCLGGCDATVSPKMKKWNIVSQPFIQSDPESNYSMRMMYPEIDSAATAEELGLNKRFLDFLGNDADSFFVFIKDFDSGMLRELDGSYNVHANGPQFLSISQRFVWAVPGTPILLGEVKCSTYDRQKKQLLALKDCFNSNTYQAELLNLVRGEVTKQYGIGICKEVESNDLAVFALDKAGMRFFLDVYSGNHACQQIEIIIPYKSMKKMLRPQIMEAFS